ncbi:MAG: FtsH protease activity modulator HflK [Burkholderiales bacterium]|nr:FtsH protease activity modulator HflK [Burkholderiales bacterium]
MSLNDPQWGKRGGGSGGPPDLDEMWRSFNQRLNRLFGRRRAGGAGGGSGDGPGGGEPLNLRQYGGGLGLLAGLIVVLWVASGFYIVVEGQRGVVLTFGKFTEITQSGLRWRFPVPFQSHEVIDLVGVRTVEVGYRNNVKTKVLREALMLTDDEAIIDVQFAVQYILKDPTEYLFNNRRPEESVLQVAETAMREIVGKSKMDFVLYEGRDKVASDAQALTQEILDRYKTGIAISKLTMQNAQPPEQVQSAFDDAVRANQDRERQKNEGQAYYNDVVPKAHGAAARLLEEANGYRQSIVSSAQGEASRFSQVLVEYKRAPGVMRERLYLETMQQILTSTTKVLVDARAGTNLLYLPLDKLLQMTGVQTVPETPSAAPRPAGEAAPADPRSRDALRTREREARP